MLVVSLVILAPASATIITVEVEGAVNSVTTDGGLALDGSVNISSVMTGYCIYDTDTPDVNPTNEDVGGYQLTTISMSIGNYTFTHDPTSPEIPYFIVVTVDRNYSAVSYVPRFDGTVYVDGVPSTYDDITWSYTTLALFDLLTSSSEYITTDALPDLDSWPELSVFDTRRQFKARFYDESNHNFQIYGEITSLTPTPEPATLLLLGLGGLALLRRRKGKNKN
jgi:hypothetical protein